ncbi:hypothetical protein ACF3MZ_06675 [Paenibacillaceae bacterium WGS1546]|uniref:hypothetical protein n=1 Tax=Cohnella sp. WGS1546 TaxID=3366810 RepID=UPI00372D1266
MIFIVLIAIFLPSGAYEFAHSAATAGATTTGMIVYGNVDREIGRRDDAQARLMRLYEILRARCDRVSLVRADEYEAGRLVGVSYVLMYGLSEGPANGELDRDLRKFEGTIGWIGGGIEHYSSLLARTNVTVDGYSDQFAELVGDPGATEPAFVGETRNVPRFAVQDDSDTETFGWLSDGRNRFPYALRDGNSWMIAADGEAFAPALERVIDRMLGLPHNAWPQVYVKLINVSPFIDLERLASTAEWLHGQGVPFIVELRPVFANTEFQEMQAYFETIRDVQRLGGTAVLGNLQGWRPPDAWHTDIERFSETKVTSPESAESLIGISLNAYADANIYPLGFSGPPDLLFDPEFERTLAYFSTFMPSRDWQGFIRDQWPDEAWTGLYVPESSILPFDSLNDWEGLQETVEDMKRNGATFADARNLEHRVMFGDRAISTERGEIRMNGQRVVYEEALPDPVEEPLPAELSDVNQAIRLAMSVLFVIAGAIVLLFASAYAAGKRIDRKKHMR